MPIIHKYKNTKMIISPMTETAIRAFIGDREPALIKIERSFVEKAKTEAKYKHFLKNNDVRMLLANSAGIFGLSYLIRIDDGLDPVAGTYLHIADHGVRGKHLTRSNYRPTEGIGVTYPSVDGLMQLLRDKRLIYRCDYAENYADVEKTVNLTLRESLFGIKRNDLKILHDKYFDVRLFLRSITDDGAGGADLMTPADVSELDVNAILLEKLKEIGKDFDKDAVNVEYESSTDGLRAQYLLSKFRLDWGRGEDDPTDVLNFRISAFILPGRLADGGASAVGDDRIVTDKKTGKRFVIDSIHFNDDICFCIGELGELIEGVAVNISLA